MNIIHSTKQAFDTMKKRRELRRFLLQDARKRGVPWRNKEALNQTIKDVFALDDDLKEYVWKFLANRTDIETNLGCQIISIEELIRSGEFSPVTAALFIQWYRESPRTASLSLLQHDSIVDLLEGGDVIPEEETEETGDGLDGEIEPETPSDGSDGDIEPETPSDGSDGDRKPETPSDGDEVRE